MRTDKVLGTVFFMHGDKKVADVPYYVGEDPYGVVVYTRAGRHAQILEPTLAQHLGSCVRRHRPFRAPAPIPAKVEVATIGL